jgi:hypothetical protein
MAYKPGLYYQVCDICGLKGYNTEMVKTWNNFIVHRSTCDDGPRSPLDKPPPLRPERPSVPDPRPRAADTPDILGTTTVTSIASTTATSGGNIPHNGGASVTEYGVCWGTSHAPDTDDDRTSDGTGTGEFTSNLTGLTASTKYYVRAYATNSVGTSYGIEAEFTTLA